MKVIKGQRGIALLSALAIAIYSCMAAMGMSGQSFLGLPSTDWPLLVALILGGPRLVFGLTRQILHREFGSDLLAGISILTSVALHQYLAGTLVVLMLSGGQALEAYAVQSASSVLEALAKRLPSIAHVKHGHEMRDAALDKVQIEDVVVVFPHEICPVDGIVTDGHGVMDESYLTGEPYMIMKAPGSEVLSGSINGESALTVRVTRLAVDSRYAKIMEVMRASAQRKPKLRRIADQLGALYTPLAVGIALAAWLISADPMRFLAVLVIATPCPLLIAIPVAIIGSISLAARRGIVIKDPATLEKIDTCRIAIFDKTGTLTYGRPNLTEIVTATGRSERDVLALVASVERYSKHPLASSVLDRAAKDRVAPMEALAISERPGEGLQGNVDGKLVEVTSRQKLPADLVAQLPNQESGMECVVLVDGGYAATMRFPDEPRSDSRNFVRHLRSRHLFKRVALLSGDRESEVRYLADKVGIKEVYFNQSPEEKLAFVTEETKRENTIFVGDGINDSPALTAATVGVAFGQKSDITSEAAGAVVMDSTLEKVDELMHVGKRMRTIALQSAYGGMALSVLGMLLASSGNLTPVVGAISQEVIDVLAVLNALRAAIPPRSLSDYRNSCSASH